jgi:signal peptidase I
LVIVPKYSPFVILLVAAGIFSMNYSTYRVNGNSMSPSLNEGDTVLLSRKAPRAPLLRALSANTGDIKRGHIVVFRVPADGTAAVKRVIAAPGDRVTIANNRIDAGGHSVPLSEPQVELLEGMIEIPNGFLFVTGDKGTRSYDSRHYGLVPVSSVLGRVVGVLRSRAGSRADE